MRLFISSSEPVRTPESIDLSDVPERIVPSGPWGRMWALGLCLAGLMFGGWEYHWRTQGFTPSLVDGPDVWSLERQRVGATQTQVVLVGASRMQVGFSRAVFHERFPNYDLVQLAKYARPPMAVLRDLSEDQDFRGIVICDAVSPYLERSYRNSLQDYVEFYRRQWTLNEQLNCRASSFFQDHLVSLNPHLNPAKVLFHRAVHGTSPTPQVLRMDVHRSQYVDYSKVIPGTNYEGRDNDIRERYHEQPPPAPDAWLVEAREIEALIQKIQQRGGKVTMVHFPVSGSLAELDEKFYPKREYWDRFAAMSSAETIHFGDVPTLAEFTCQDGSHLDYHDAPRFTAALLDELVRRKFLSSATVPLANRDVARVGQ